MYNLILCGTGTCIYHTSGVLVLAGQSTKMLCDLRGSGIGSSPREGDGVMVGARHREGEVGWSC